MVKQESLLLKIIVSLDEVTINGESGILSNMNNDNSQQQNQLFTNDISNTENKIKTESISIEPVSMRFLNTNTFLTWIIIDNDKF